MSQDSEEKNQIYHIDADVLLNYQWYDDPGQQDPVRSLFNRKNIGDIEIRINTFALGEVLQNIFKKHLDRYEKIDELKKLYESNRLKIFELRNIETKSLTEQIGVLRSKDNRIGNGDILNLAIFVLDPDAKKFKTFSIDIAYSQKIHDYLDNFGKKISPMEFRKEKKKGL